MNLLFYSTNAIETLQFPFYSRFHKTLSCRLRKINFILNINKANKNTWK